MDGKGEEDSGVHRWDDFAEPCGEDLNKPYIGQKFTSEEEAIAFYKKYGQICGFDVRLGSATRSSDKEVNIWRYILCNREGEKTNNKVVGDVQEEGSTKRRRVSNRCNCMARIVIKYIGTEGYVVTQYINRHTHMLADDNSKHFLKINRKIEFVHQKFFLSCHRASIGPMKSFKLMKETFGGYQNMGCSSIDFKNFGRDLRAYVAGSDAQMVLDNMHDKRERWAGFVFDYLVDEDHHLNCIFWADPIARRNYHVFGDVVSFDATYDTNKYGMRFLPFTGKNNHGKIITFAAGLIARENVESYTWVLEKFKSCMEKFPRIILTDQDPAVKIAIERVMGGTRHRLCMWHIMKKVPGKVAKMLDENEDFLNRFSSIVWCDFISPEKFEAKWAELMGDYRVGKDDWFKSMYDIRKMWIPAYFLDVPMGGLIKTTSISENVNNFYGTYTRPHANLVEFFMHFENALEAQQHSNARLNDLDKTSQHDLRTQLQIEKHAQATYTNNIFKEVQEQIVDACYHCRILQIDNVADEQLHLVGNRDPLQFTVRVNEVEKTIVCGCKRFERVGQICCHIFVVLKNQGIEEIPDKYVMWRWSKQAYTRPVHNDVAEVPIGAISVDGKKLMLNSIYSKFQNVLAMIEGAEIDTMEVVSRGLTDLEQVVRDVISSTHEIPTKEVIFEGFFGRKLPKEINVLPPQTVRAKGSGSRLISRKEKETRKAQKPLRKCSSCKKMSRHDARNCPADKEADESGSDNHCD